VGVPKRLTNQSRTTGCAQAKGSAGKVVMSWSASISRLFKGNKKNTGVVVIAA
jgi:hypothetical protein